MNAWKVSCSETISEALRGSVLRTLFMDSSCSSRDWLVYLEGIHSATTSRKSSQLSHSPIELIGKRPRISVPAQTLSKTRTYLGHVSFRALCQFLQSLRKTCLERSYVCIDEGHAYNGEICKKESLFFPLFIWSTR